MVVDCIVLVGWYYDGSTVACKEGCYLGNCAQKRISSTGAVVIIVVSICPELRQW